MLASVFVLFFQSKELLTINKTYRNRHRRTVEKICGYLFRREAICVWIFFLVGNGWKTSIYAKKFISFNIQTRFSFRILYIFFVHLWQLFIHLNFNYKLKQRKIIRFEMKNYHICACVSVWVCVFQCLCVRCVFLYILRQSSNQ